VRDLRQALGVILVQRPASVPVPSRLCQRDPSDPERPKNAYVREDEILPHLAAISILLGE
jgi:site-specific DNA recombinase